MAIASAATAARSGVPQGVPVSTFHAGADKVKRPVSSPLGITAKSVNAAADDIARKAKRAAKFRLLDAAAALLPGERVAGCQRRPSGSAVAVHRTAQGRASVRGLQQCGSVWHCPYCSPRISAGRRDELNKLLAWGKSRKLIPVLLTLTGRHQARDPLFTLMEAMKAAKKRLHQGRYWRAVADSVEGHVTATELTHGRNGWHVHFHALVLVREATEAAALQTLRGLRSEWERALATAGLSCNDHGFDVQGAARAGDYVAKWGAAEELALSGAKSARSEKGRTVWQLLDAATHEDQAASRLWTDYARLFKGRRQLVWSRGLKAQAGIDDIADEALIEVIERGEELTSSTEIARLTAPEWKALIRAGLRCELLEAVETAGVDGLNRVLAQLRSRHGPHAHN